MQVPPSCTKRSAETLKMPRQGLQRETWRKMLMFLTVPEWLPGCKSQLCPRTVALLGPLLFFPPASSIQVYTPHLCPLPCQPGALQLCHPFYPRYLWSMTFKLPSPEGLQGCASSLHRACHCLVPGPLPHCIFCILKVWPSCSAFLFFPSPHLSSDNNLNCITTRQLGFLNIQGDRGNFHDDRCKVA